MPDKTYCYPNSEVLINKLNIRNQKDLFEAEKELTYIRLKELQDCPIKGNFDFKHLKDIHKYIFQDLYDWAGQIRTVEIGKGNLFCTTPCIQSYADTVFKKYYFECNAHKDNKEDYIWAFAQNYGDLNALHPFREGNGRTQREFARLICMQCGYAFDLSVTTHEEMLMASKISFDKGDNQFLRDIFSRAVIQKELYYKKDEQYLKILTSDDLIIKDEHGKNDYYGYESFQNIQFYNQIYNAKIEKMKKE